ncbi:MAG: hypothetical protein WA962_07915 [Ornithinimicrobium sp.]
MTEPQHDPTQPVTQGPRDRQGFEPAERESVIRPTGVSWTTVVLGILCLALATVIVTLQLGDLVIDWSIATPAVVVGAGVVLVVLGLFSLLRSRSEQEPPAL